MSPQEALGPERVARLADVRTWLEAERALSDEAETTTVTLVPLAAADVPRWQRRATARDEKWVFYNAPDGRVFLVDEPSEAAHADPAGAVFYPELHSRAIGWWLIHAWRLTNLAEETLKNLEAWRIDVAAVAARAALEEVACLLYEARALTAAWAIAKDQPLEASALERAVSVRNSMMPVLNKAAYGTRMKFLSHLDIQAPNVMTYIQKLAKALHVSDVEDLYSWLSDAAHPALASRIALASEPVVHDSGTVMLNYLARRPVRLRSADGAVQDPHFTIAYKAADALILTAKVGQELLAHGLRVVDDIGLTTGAATLTRRTYWRALRPVKGSRRCPCGRGQASDCNHRWGAFAPVLDCQVMAT
jgi:hypothetical protein